MKKTFGIYSQDRHNCVTIILACGEGVDMLENRYICSREPDPSVVCKPPTWCVRGKPKAVVKGTHLF